MDKNERRAKREAPAPRTRVAKMSVGGKLYMDYKETETLRKLTAGNGKMLSRRRTGACALEQRMVAQAVKRARYMALVPYQTASQ
jgi:small subunit ribosomal protein S18